MEAQQPEQPRMRRGREFDLIAAVRERLGTPSQSGTRRVIGIGDDAAVTVPPGATATSVDALVEGVHFRSSWCPPRAVGRKAMAAALSDLAAMGAEAGEAYVWLGCPAAFSDEDCLAVADGLAEVAGDAGVAVLGGDLTAAPSLALAITAVGHAADPGDLVGRSGALAGDAVCLSGEIGAASAGLMLLEHPRLREEVPAASAEAAIARQLGPTPRLALGRALAASGATAMIDLSDGLGGDAEQLAAASGVGLEIEMARVPVAPAVAEVARAGGRDPLELAIGGEDYELLCTIPRASLERAVEAAGRAGVPLTEIGRVSADPGVRLRLPGGRSLPARGFDQLG